MYYFNINKVEIVMYKSCVWADSGKIGRQVLVGLESNVDDDVDGVGGSGKMGGESLSHSCQANIIDGWIRCQQACR